MSKHWIAMSGSVGCLPDHCEVVGGEFWTSEIARHDRLRLAYAVWSVLARRLLSAAQAVTRRCFARRTRSSSAREGGSTQPCSSAR